MTGEMTLSGRVLPIGGVREKSLAALSHGVTTVILPMSNKKDLADIPEDFKKRVNFVFVENLDEVFALALDRKAGAPRAKAKDTKKAKSPAVVA